MVLSQSIDILGFGPFQSLLYFLALCFNSVDSDCVTASINLLILVIVSAFAQSLDLLQAREVDKTG